MSTLIDSYSETNYNAGILMSDAVSNGKDGIGQAILTTKFYHATSVKAYMGKTGSPTGTIVAKLYACTGTPGSTGAPTGVTLGTSAALDVSTLGAMALVEFVFATPVPIPAGGVCIALEKVTGTYDNGNYVRVGVDTSQNHAGNLFTADTVGTWTADGTQDMCFYLYGSAFVGQPIFIL